MSRAVSIKRKRKVFQEKGPASSQIPGNMKENDSYRDQYMGCGWNTFLEKGSYKGWNEKAPWGRTGRVSFAMPRLLEF